MYAGIVLNTDNSEDIFTKTIILNKSCLSKTCLKLCELVLLKCFGDFYKNTFLCTLKILISGNV